ncbi:MAG: hypothetical protein KKD39_07590 [Candidatus Altiarchaeota archaeon]|nr:hypothetical protein [Candidatus Altiarchaeota archaeon]
MTSQKTKLNSGLIVFSVVLCITLFSMVSQVFTPRPSKQEAASLAPQLEVYSVIKPMSAENTVDDIESIIIVGGGNITNTTSLNLTGLRVNVSVDGLEKEIPDSGIEMLYLRRSPYGADGLLTSGDVLSAAFKIPKSLVGGEKVLLKFALNNKTTVVSFNVPEKIPSAKTLLWP